MRIKEFKKRNETVADKNIIEKWIYESEHYVAALDSFGNEKETEFKKRGDE